MIIATRICVKTGLRLIYCGVCIYIYRNSYSCAAKRLTFKVGSECTKGQMLPSRIKRQGPHFAVYYARVALTIVTNTVYACDCVAIVVYRDYH